MKVFELLCEAKKYQSFDDFIKTNCSSFMKEIDANIDMIRDDEFSLYRGLRPASLGKEIPLSEDGRVGVAYLKKVRDDRKPKDTPKVISDIVDDYLEEKFGWRPRSQAVFCYPYKNRDDVELYGKMHKIYPMGEIQFVYSPTVKDMTFELSTYLREHGVWPANTNEIEPEKLEETIAVIKRFMDNSKYTNKNLHNAMTKGKPEIMIKCNEYLVIPANGMSTYNDLT